MPENIQQSLAERPTYTEDDQTLAKVHFRLEGHTPMTCQRTYPIYPRSGTYVLVSNSPSKTTEREQLKNDQFEAALYVKFHRNCTAPDLGLGDHIVWARCCHKPWEPTFDNLLKYCKLVLADLMLGRVWRCTLTCVGGSGGTMEARRNPWTPG